MPLEPGREVPNESGLVELGRTQARAESQAVAAPHGEPALPTWTGGRVVGPLTRLVDTRHPQQLSEVMCPSTFLQAAGGIPSN